MNNTIREIIKSNLQKLSKDELVDALVLFGSGMFSLGMNAGKYLYKKGL